ncbi:O-methyltransferase [Amycolatopsis echigonensis]|uniref:O-methyltransferase n=1 Tax=Amycolatopsis echigonensis TaxID=2576905 RepID=A0A2N3WJD7_9PSEU|nr:methyltransferase [Amycolatopsis niigatensis]PKV93966.1 O-methyltransferase [Amycolatopsis niigatensis]
MTRTSHAPVPVDLVRRLEHLAVGAGVAACLQAAIKLGIPDAISTQPTTREVIAKTVRAHPVAVGRLLRTLSSQGVFTQVDEGLFAHNELSQMLTEDAPFGLRHLVTWLGAAWTWEAWPQLDQAVRTGEAVVPRLYGKPFYQYLNEDAPESSAVFDKAMTAVSSLSSGRVVEAFDVTGIGTVVDVAGGQGHLLRTLLERYPDLHGVLFDLAGTVSEADRALVDGELADRCRIVAGDCIKEMTVAAEMYILKNILDWPDDNSLSTLRNIAAAAKPGARVVVVDSIMDSDPLEMQVTSVIDLFMLLNVGGQRHTRRDFRELFERAGFSLVRTAAITETFPTLHLVEAQVTS